MNRAEIPLMEREPETLSEALEIIRELRKVNEELRSQVSELLELLKLNSKNSSIPPSRDRNKGKQDRKKSGKRRGGQPKNKNHKRVLYSAEQVTEVVECPVSENCECGGKVIKSPQTRIHQVVEIPDILPFTVTEYRITKGRCNCCKRYHFGKLPIGTPRGVCGSRLLSFMSVLSSKYHLSKRLVKELLEQQFGIRLSLGTISHNEALVSESLKPVYDELIVKSQTSPIKHVDETGFKINHKNGWLWTVANSDLVVFALCGSRGKRMAQALLGTFNTYVISDRYGGYDWLPTEKRQLCLAHILRDFIRISQRDNPVGILGKRLVVALREIFHHWHNWLVAKPTILFSQIPRFKKLQNIIKSLLIQGTRSKHPKTAGTCNKILDKFDSLWTFADCTTLEPTNNYAERVLRPAVIYKKLCYGVDSFRGARFIERILSISVTEKINNRNILTLINNKINEFFEKQHLSLRSILKMNHQSQFIC
jgi:transposase